MILSEEDIRPIYVQIAEGIEDEILKGILEEEEQVLSKNQFASEYRINPATAAKGINTLADEGIIYKKRGIGMFVAPGARERIREKRKKKFFEEYVEKMLQEAEKIGISSEDIKGMLDEYKSRKG